MNHTNGKTPKRFEILKAAEFHANGKVSQKDSIIGSLTESVGKKMVLSPPYVFRAGAQPLVKAAFKEPVAPASAWNTSGVITATKKQPFKQRNTFSAKMLQYLPDPIYPQILTTRPIIKELRLKKNLSQENLARKLNLHKTQAARLESRDPRYLTVEDLKRLSPVFGLHTFELFQMIAGAGKESWVDCSSLSRPSCRIRYEAGVELAVLTRKADFFFGVLTLPPHQSFGRKQSFASDLRFCLVLEGLLRLSLGQKEFVFKPNECFYLPERFPCELCNPEPLRKTLALFVSMSSQRSESY